MRERMETTIDAATQLTAVRVADMAAALALLLLLFPVIAFVGVVATQRDADASPLWQQIRRFRGDQLMHLFDVLRGERSFFAEPPCPRVFGD